MLDVRVTLSPPPKTSASHVQDCARLLSDEMFFLGEGSGFQQKRNHCIQLLVNGLTLFLRPILNQAYFLRFTERNSFYSKYIILNIAYIHLTLAKLDGEMSHDSRNIVCRK